MKPNQLNLFDLTMIVIGLVIGMGIFRTSRDVAQAALSPTIFFLAWIVGGLVAFCGALTYAEIGSRYPVTGGYYKIFSYAYHPSIAFAINCIILISNAASLSGVALIGAEYIAPVFIKSGGTDLTRALIAMSAIILFYAVNLMGLRISAKTQNVLMLIKITMLLILIAALFFPSLYAQAPPQTSHSYSFGALLLSFGIALKATSFTYGGYQQTINFGAEIQNPRRNIPRGIFIGILVIMSIYMAVSYSYFKVIGFQALKADNPNSAGIAAIVAGKMFGPTGTYLASILLFLAVLAYVNVLLLSNPRVMYAMSEDGILPASFQRKGAKRDVLTVSLTVFAAICIVVLFFAKTFNQIISFSIFLDSIGMATSAATIFILRRRHVGEPAGTTRPRGDTGEDEAGGPGAMGEAGQIYTMKLYPLLPLIFILAYTFVGIMIAFENWHYAALGLATFTAFLLIYFAARKWAKQRAAP